MPQLHDQADPMTALDEIDLDAIEGFVTGRRESNRGNQLTAFPNTKRPRLIDGAARTTAGWRPVLTLHFVEPPGGSDYFVAADGFLESNQTYLPEGYENRVREVYAALDKALAEHLDKRLVHVPHEVAEHNRRPMNISDGDGDAMSHGCSYNQFHEFVSEHTQSFTPLPDDYRPTPTLSMYGET